MSYRSTILVGMYFSNHYTLFIILTSVYNFQNTMHHFHAYQVALLTEIKYKNKRITRWTLQTLDDKAR